MDFLVLVWEWVVLELEDFLVLVWELVVLALVESLDLELVLKDMLQPKQENMLSLDVLVGL